MGLPHVCIRRSIDLGAEWDQDVRIRYSNAIAVQFNSVAGGINGRWYRLSCLVVRIVSRSRWHHLDLDEGFKILKDSGSKKDVQCRWTWEWN